MIEGLWTVQFLTANDPTMEMNGGVVVIETGRILGGDSGYFYVGNLHASGNGHWAAELTITRHDPNILSVFGDLNVFTVSGAIEASGTDESGRETLFASLDHPSGLNMTCQLAKVSELP